jgi:hypothetical protein
MHNFFIKGDPVPVAQLLLVHNRAAIERLGGYAYAYSGIKKEVEAAAKCMHGYRPVGSVYVSTLKDPFDLTHPEFVLVQPNALPFQEWDCVKRSDFGVHYHDIINHCNICSGDALAFLERAKNHKAGLYVQNETEHDLLFVMIQSTTTVHWKRVPK